MTHVAFESQLEEIVDVLSGAGSSATGTIVNLEFEIESTSRSVDMFILPGSAGRLYALFDYGLTFRY